MAIRYLLGNLSEEDKTRLEEQYFLDDKKFEQFELAEDELIDRYVRSELSPKEKDQFEKLLESPRFAERVEVARLLAKRTMWLSQKQTVIATPESSNVQVKPPPVSWWDRLFGPTPAIPVFRPAFAMSLILLLLATTAFVFVWVKLGAESEQLAQEQQQRDDLRRQIEEQKARYSELEAKLDKTQQEKDEQAELTKKYQELLAQEQQRSVSALIFPIFLTPSGGTRGLGSSAVKEIMLPRGVRRVGFNLNVTHGGEDYRRYNASVRNIDAEKRIAINTNLKPISRGGRKYIAINLDATVLRAGSYNIHVDGVTASGQIDNFDDYPFRVKFR
jgi:DNA-binding transcriptional ArsR family regulator